MDAIPQELQLPLVVVVGLIGFLVVIGLSKLSAAKDPIPSVSSPAAPSTPQKSPAGNAGTPVEKKVGSVMTPGGRRSARIAKQRRKED